MPMVKARSFQSLPEKSGRSRSAYFPDRQLCRLDPPSRARSRSSKLAPGSFALLRVVRSLTLCCLWTYRPIPLVAPYLLPRSPALTPKLPPLCLEYTLHFLQPAKSRQKARTTLTGILQVFVRMSMLVHRVVTMGVFRSAEVVRMPALSYFLRGVQPARESVFKGTDWSGHFVVRLFQVTKCRMVKMEIQMRAVSDISHG